MKHIRKFNEGDRIKVDLRDLINDDTIFINTSFEYVYIVIEFVGKYIDGLNDMTTFWFLGVILKNVGVVGAIVVLYLLIYGLTVYEDAAPYPRLLKSILYKLSIFEIAVNVFVGLVKKSLHLYSIFVLIFIKNTVLVFGIQAPFIELFCDISVISIKFQFSPPLVV